MGDNAIDRLLDILQDLRSATFPGDDVLGGSTLNIGILTGGGLANVVPDRASAEAILRLATAKEAVKKSLAGIVRNRGELIYDFECEPVYMETLAGFETTVFRSQRISRCSTAGESLFCWDPDPSWTRMRPGNVFQKSSFRIPSAFTVEWLSGFCERMIPRHDRDEIRRSDGAGRGMHRKRRSHHPESPAPSARDRHFRHGQNDPQAVGRGPACLGRGRRFRRSGPGSHTRES
jgi:hypothetical protein